MWAAYFIPRWLRRHEELSESRSVEKFDHAMRILSRRDADPGPALRRHAAAPRGAAAAACPPAARCRPSARHRSAAGVGAAAIRRRRILAGLLLTTLRRRRADPADAGAVVGAGPAAGRHGRRPGAPRVQVAPQREVSRTRKAVRQRVAVAADALRRAGPADDRAARDGRGPRRRGGPLGRDRGGRCGSSGRPRSAASPSRPPAGSRCRCRCRRTSASRWHRAAPPRST